MIIIRLRPIMNASWFARLLTALWLRHAWHVPTCAVPMVLDLPFPFEFFSSFSLTMIEAQEYLSAASTGRFLSMDPN
jgi:hypothetical protein